MKEEKINEKRNNYKEGGEVGEEERERSEGV